jgi:hypothetical protein
MGYVNEYEFLSELLEDRHTGLIYRVESPVCSI